MTRLEVYSHDARRDGAGCGRSACNRVAGHAGRFVLAKHTWDDPYKRLALASRRQDYRLLTPMLGEPVILSEPDQPFTARWQQATQ